MKISDWMKTDLVTITSDMTIEEAIKTLIEKRVGTLPVISPEGVLEGLVIMKDLLGHFLPDFFSLLENIDFIENFGALELPSRDLLSLLNDRVSEHMDRKPHYVSPQCSVLSAVALMARHNLVDLLIVEKGRLKGLVSTVDLGVAFLNWIRENVPPSEENGA